ncbi:MAG TPA: transglutaminase domain-containing protein [Methanocella sp.]|nr:transglutaminase domain-containing protein [Methanocella sp.]
MTIIIVSFYSSAITRVNADSLAGTIIIGGSMSTAEHVKITDTFTDSNLNCAGLNGSKIIFQAPVYDTTNVNGFSQSVSNFNINANPAPDSISTLQTDNFGNHYYTYTWDLTGFSGSKTIAVQTDFDVTTIASPTPDSFNDPYPVSASGMSQYTNPTDTVQSSNDEIKSKAISIVGSANTEAEAVNRIMDFVRINIPTQDPNVNKDALSSLHSSSGSCLNRANLALGLLRSINIPARFVNGFVSDVPYNVPFDSPAGSGAASFNWGKEMHAWIEVYYPQKGWVAYDPYMNKGFLDTRHVITGTALDSAAGNPSTGGTIDTFTNINVNHEATGKFDTTIDFSGVSDSGSYTSRGYDSNPTGALVLGRDMVNSPTPTPTSTPSASPTPTPIPTANGSINATATPPGNNNTSGIGPSSLPGAGKKYIISGIVVDDRTGARIKNVSILVDGTQVSVNSNGTFNVSVARGNHTISASAPGYGRDAINVTMAENNTTVVMRMKEAAGSAGGTPRAPAPTPGFGTAMALAGILITALYYHGRRA